VIGADGKKQGIAGAQTQHMLVRESCRCAELKTGHQQMVKLSALSRAIIASASARCLDLSAPELHGKGRTH
jgi:hypothetical protein